MATTLTEADYLERLHPRDRLGRWIRTFNLPTLEVGGAVRDLLLGKEPKDVDFIAFGTPEEIKAAVEATGHKAEDLKVRDRVVGVRAYGPDIPPGGVEIAPPRIEKSTGPGRKDFEIVPHPDAGNPEAIHEDAVRRDFTVNALYRSPETGEVQDPTGKGLKDLDKRVLRTTHSDSFRDDPLRILRAARFAAQHNLQPEPDTLQQMKDHADAITALTQKGVSGTAADELNKMLLSDKPSRGLRLLRDTGALQSLLPELAPMIGFKQESKYHDLTVDEHTFRVVDSVAEQGGSLAARMAALFHDSGKPESAWRGKDGRLHYYANPAEGKRAHEEISADIAQSTLKRLNYPAGLSKNVVAIVRNHMLPEANKPKEVKARRLLSRLDGDVIHDLLIHRRADMTSKGEDDDNTMAGNVDKLAELVDQNAEAPVRVSDLEITGHDLIDAGIPAGPERGEVLERLLKQVIGQPELNNREWLLRQLRKGGRKGMRSPGVERRNGYDTGIFFHATPADVGEYVEPRREGAEGTFPFPAEPDAVYLWPTEKAAKQWTEYVKRRNPDSPEMKVVPVHADTAMLEPDPEPFYNLLRNFQADEGRGEHQANEQGYAALDEARWFPDPVADLNGETLREYLRRTGAKVWSATSPTDATPEHLNVDPWAESRAVLANMPASLRREVARVFAENELAVLSRGPRPVAGMRSPGTEEPNRALARYFAELANPSKTMFHVTAADPEALRHEGLTIDPNRRNFPKPGSYMEQLMNDPVNKSLWRGFNTPGVYLYAHRGDAENHAKKHGGVIYEIDADGLELEWDDFGVGEAYRSPNPIPPERINFGHGIPPAPAMRSLDRRDYEEHIAENGPWLYHYTKPELLKKIVDEGLRPRGETGVAHQSEPPSIPTRVYMRTGEPTVPDRERMVKIDMRQLDPAKFKADEDVLYEDPEDGSPGGGDFEGPEHTRWSLGYGLLAYEGTVPPEAIERISSYSGMRSPGIETEFRSKKEEVGEFPREAVDAPPDVRDRLIAEHKAKERAWETKMLRGIALGQITEEEAKNLGLYTSSGEFGYMPLPETTFHVTTNPDAVRESGGLKTRQELGVGGLGLGAGPDDFISLTDDHDIAESIALSMVEAGRAARGEISTQDMIDAARAGDGADEPWFGKLMDAYGYGPEIGPSVQRLLDEEQGLRDGTLSDDWEVQEQNRSARFIGLLGEGWEPVPGSETGEDDPWDGQPIMGQMRRRRSDRVREERWDFYKKWAAYRQFAGGRLDPLFMAVHSDAAANMREEDIGIVTLKAKPGAHGTYHLGLSEWRVPTGDAVEISHIEPYLAERRPEPPLRPDLTSFSSLRFRRGEAPGLASPSFAPIPESEWPEAVERAKDDPIVLGQLRDFARAEEERARVKLGFAPASEREALRERVKSQRHLRHSADEALALLAAPALASPGVKWPVHRDALETAEEHPWTFDNATLPGADDRYRRMSTRSLQRLAQMPGVSIGVRNAANAELRRRRRSGRPNLTPKQREALKDSNKLDALARNPEPGTVIWRGEVRLPEETDPEADDRTIGLHWTVNPSAVIHARTEDVPDSANVVWQATVTDPVEQTIPRTHPIWSGRSRSMNWEAEVRLDPGSEVPVDGAWVWEGEGRPKDFWPVNPERMNPGWKFHPVVNDVPIEHLPGPAGVGIDYSRFGFGGGMRSPVVIPERVGSLKTTQMPLQETDVLDIFDGFTASGLTVEPESISVAFGMMEQKGNIKTVGGEDVGEYEFTFRQAGTWPDGSPRYRAWLDGLFLKPEVQGGGFADSFMRHVEDEARKLGVDGIGLYATNVGAYAWARQGYQFSEAGEGVPSALDSARVIVDDLLYEFDAIQNPAAWLREKGAPGSPEDHQRLWDEFRAKLPTEDDIVAYQAGDINAFDGKLLTPQEVAMWGFDEPHWQWNGIDWWFGKAFLVRNARWPGFKPISGRLEEASSQEIGDFYWEWLAGRERGKTLDGMWLLDDTDFWQRWRERSGMTTLVTQ